MTTSSLHPPAAPGSDDRQLLAAYMLASSCDGRWLIGRTDSGAARGRGTARAVLPGGRVRDSESPVGSLARATTEQLGISLPPRRLIAAAWAEAAPCLGETALIFAGPLVVPDLLPQPPDASAPPELIWQLSDPTQALVDLPTALADAVLGAGFAPPIGYSEIRTLYDQPIGTIQPAYARGSVLDTPSPCCTGHTARLTHNDLEDITDDATTGVHRKCSGCRSPYLLYLLGTRQQPQGVRWQPR
ncbi:hypothetical protein [Actinomadura sp. 6K520]|uniref:hypothetical protein n=1 Tax=Actinomadura sp. 6K520 TaxID=2530364 RepID=UPI00104AABD6|nr:hypothetical protein [Actinomadura sp. 6K520]TDE14153.1 hypothetical protein E1289_37200 [Actinomadura sp. 6K520]